MDSSVVVTIVVAAAVAWLAFLGVSALRSRGPEEVPSNLRPGQSDDVMETKRLERSQQAAVLLSAFLAIGLPLYYLSEPARQDSFATQFDEESVMRGDHLVQEYGCFGCHGPGGVGGSAKYVEKRTGASVAWTAPPINNVFYRYDRDLVRYWITYGRQNTPMPAWGLAGGGPLSEAQVEDVLNYLQTIQVQQAESANLVDQNVEAALSELDGAGDAIDSAILNQRQTIADLSRATELAPIATSISDRASAAFAKAGEGVDTDGDGISDTVENELTSIAAEAAKAFSLPGLAPLELDPANPATDGTPDAERVAAVVDTLRSLSESTAPIVAIQLNAIETALQDTGTDTDGDGISDTAEGQIVAQVQAAQAAVLPSQIHVVTLDPQNPESVSGEPDETTASRIVSGLSSLAVSLNVSKSNIETLLPPAKQALTNLQNAKEKQAWAFDFQAIADQDFNGDVDKAKRVVGLFNSNCARCHTSGYSAGVAFAQEAGSGGFAPALWDGRPAIQFLSDDDLVQFLIKGAVANAPYGVNGMGNGQMPAFGETLSEQDLADLAHWLRAGNLTGMGGNN